MGNEDAQPDAGGAGPERSRELEELLFQCLELRSKGDTDALARLLSLHPAHAADLERLLAVVDGMDRGQPLPHLGEYELLHPIGGGGMGVVYLARQRRLQRLVAIKLIRPEMLGSSKMRERFQREARALARVAHPGICPIYDSGEVDGQPYLVIQFIAGKRWSEQRAPQSRHELDQLLRQCEQVCEAVQVAHDAGLVHRDLKPANVLLSEGGRPVILDFGLARMISGGETDEPLLTTQSQPVGTPAYMAPERLTGSADAAGPGVDVYALGVTLYQLVSGTMPFHSPVLEALWSQILRGDPPMQPLRKRWIPRELEVVVRTAMEPDPARRYDTARSLGEDLRRLRLGLPTLARRPSAATRVVRWTQRNRAVTGLLVGLAAALVVAGALVLNLELERRHNRSLALAGEATRHGAKNAALQTRLALAAMAEEDLASSPTARSELAQGLAGWQLREVMVDADEWTTMAVPLPLGGMATLVDNDRAVVSRELGGRRELRRRDGGAISAIAISPDEGEFALGGQDGKLFLLDLEGGTERTIEVGADPITMLAYAPGGGARLAIATDRVGEDEHRRADLLLLDRGTGSLRPLGSYEGERLLVLQFLFTRDASELLAVLQTRNVVVFHLDEPGRPATELPVQRPRVAVLARDDQAVICGCASGAMVEVPLQGGPAERFGVQRMIQDMKLSADGQMLATCGWDRTAKLWDLEQPAEQRTPVVIKHPAVVTAVAFRDDGQLLATCDKGPTLRLFSMQGDPLLELPGNLAASYLLRLDSQGVWMASERYGSGRLALQSHGQDLRLSDFAITILLPSRRSSQVWAGHGDGYVRLFADGSSRVFFKHKDAITSLELSADEQSLLSVGHGQQAFVHDLVTGTEQELEVPTPGELRAGWFLDEGRVVCLQLKGNKADGNALVRFVRDPKSARYLLDGARQLLPAGLDSGNLDASAGRLLFGRANEGGHLSVDPFAAAPVQTVDGVLGSTVLRSPDGRLLASCGTSDITLVLPGGETKTLPTDSSRTECMRFSPDPDSRFLAAVSHSGAVWMFDTTDGHLVWRGQLPAIGWSLAFTPDGEHLLTGDSDGVVRPWLVRIEDQRALAKEMLAGWRWNDEERRILEANGVDPDAR